MHDKTKSALRYLSAGGAAGLANGFFGAGGGMLLVPAFALCGLDDRKSLATSVAVMLPLCAVSAAAYYLRGNLDIAASLPYCAGGLAGGIIAGIFFKKAPPAFLRRLMGGFIAFAGVRMLFFS